MNHRADNLIDQRDKLEETLRELTKAAHKGDFCILPAYADAQGQGELIDQFRTAIVQAKEVLS